jgi:hypothetical protein
MRISLSKRFGRSSNPDSRLTKADLQYTFLKQPPVYS